MELRHLRYFVAAAEELHFRHAAERLHIVQPALSRQIHLLEEELEARLFERLAHGVRLTEAGRVFLDGARPLLHELSMLTEKTRRAARGQAGLLRVGFNAVGTRSAVVPEAFSRFRAAYPEVELQLTLQKSQAQLQALERGDLDAGFLFDRPRDHPDLEAVLIQQDGRGLLVPATHALANVSPLRLAQLHDEPFVLMRREPEAVAYDRIMAACLAGGLSPRIVQEADDEHTIVSLVLVGMGLSFLTCSAAERLPPGVMLRPVEDFSVPMSLELVWRRSRLSPALARFIDTVSAVLDDTRSLSPPG